LQQDASDPADREGDAYALLVPLVACEVDREERAHPRLDVREKEVEPIEST
jgi:hypothetical protein